MKKIVVLGSTGSIGTQTLEIVRAQNDISVAALCARNNIELLETQIREFHPAYAVVWEENGAKQLRDSVRDLDVRILVGMDGLLQVAGMEDYDILVSAVVGMLGIRPTIAAMKAGKTVALANKETLVTAGHIIMPLAQELNVPILPVDSEHSAIFQALNGESQNSIRKIWLTASGGPFRGKKSWELKTVGVEEALKHPVWSMGRKISVDSATLVNKGLEVMEAKWLFQVELSQIQVVVHPQSVIHSMVEYEDGGIIAQLGTPDMRLPIQYALYYPERRPLNGKGLDFYELASMTFERPDMETFSGLALAYKAMRGGGNLPTIYNAADEKAVAMFLDRKIFLPEISEIIQGCMENCRYRENPGLEEIFETEAEVYQWIEEKWK